MKVSINFFWWTVGTLFGIIVAMVFIDMLGLDYELSQSNLTGFVIGTAIGTGFQWYGVSKACGSLRRRWLDRKYRKEYDRKLKFETATL